MCSVSPVIGSCSPKVWVFMMEVYTPHAERGEARLKEGLCREGVEMGRVTGAMDKGSGKEGGLCRAT